MGDHAAFLVALDDRQPIQGRGDLVERAPGPLGELGSAEWLALPKEPEDSEREALLGGVEGGMGGGELGRQRRDVQRLGSHLGSLRHRSSVVGSGSAAKFRTAQKRPSSKPSSIESWKVSSCSAVHARAA